MVSAGGAIGSLARFLISSLFARESTLAFPLGTFIVNIAGCFLMGIFYSLAERFNVPTEWRLFFTTGFCGGFTTFSTFSYENLNLLQTGQYLYFATYSLGSFVLGLLAVILGIYSIKTIFL